MQCVILAGGLGTRMWPDTEAVPKAMLTVAGQPFAFWQLSWLANAGISSVTYCIGHLGHTLADYVGDGRKWNLSVNYVDEGANLRGTAGALRLALDEGRLERDFLVLYADSWLDIDPAEVLRTARVRQQPALMTAFRNDGRWDASNVILDGDRVTRYEKGLDQPPPEMKWIDYGLLAFRREIIADRVSPGQKLDLAPMCTALAMTGQMAGLEAMNRFYEIGSFAGRAETEQLLLSLHSRKG